MFITLKHEALQYKCIDAMMCVCEHKNTHSAGKGRTFLGGSKDIVAGLYYFKGLLAG